MGGASRRSVEISLEGASGTTPLARPHPLHSPHIRGGLVGQLGITVAAIGIVAFVTALLVMNTVVLIANVVLLSRLTRREREQQSAAAGDSRS